MFLNYANLTWPCLKSANPRVGFSVPPALFVALSAKCYQINFTKNFDYLLHFTNLILRSELMPFWPNFSTTILKRRSQRRESFEKSYDSNFSVRNLSPSNRKCSSRVKSPSCSSIRSENDVTYVYILDEFCIEFGINILLIRLIRRSIFSAAKSVEFVCSRIEEFLSN